MNDSEPVSAGIHNERPALRRVEKLSGVLPLSLVGFSKRILGVVLATQLLALWSCGGKPAAVTAGGQAETIEAPPAAATGNPVAAEVVATPESERRILEYVPMAYGVLAHISLSKVEASEFFNTHESTLLRGLEAKRQAVVQACHFDPMLSLETVTFGLDMQNQSTPDLIGAITTSLGASRIEDCVRAMGGTVEAGRYKIGGSSVAAYWPTDDVLLLSSEKTSEEMKQGLRAGRALDNPVLMQYLSRTDRHATAWGGGGIPSAVASSLGGLGGIPVGFVLRASLWAGLDVSLEISFNDKAAAEGMANMLRMGLRSAGQSSPMRELIEAVEIDQIGPTLRLDAQFSPELAAALLKELL